MFYAKFYMKKVPIRGQSVGDISRERQDKSCMVFMNQEVSFNKFDKGFKVLENSKGR